MRQPGDIIAERYRVVGTLGRGGMGTTYEADDLQTERRVAVKELSFRQMGDWKVLELFEREARVLAHLDHPGIPHYLDYFQVDSEQDRCFYLVQDLAPGQSLAALARDGWHADEGEARDVALQVLEILVYLHGLVPPVIHRDIKPSNVIRAEDGRISLVDFGSVQDTYRDTMTRGSTVVGTYGYMAPEQFRGRAVPGSDIYGLAATMLFLMTHRSPADLPQRKLKLDFRSKVRVSGELADWLERALEPDTEDRFADAREALAALRGERGSGRLVARKVPAGSKVALTRTSQKLQVAIPPAGLASQNLFVLIFTIFWNAFVFFWTSTAWAVGAPLFFLLFSIPFWIVGLGLLGSSLFGIAGHTTLELGPREFLLKWRMFGLHYLIKGRTEDIDRVELTTSYRRNAQPVTACAIVEGVRTHRFGSSMAEREKEWLVEEMADFLNLRQEEAPRSTRAFDTFTRPAQEQAVQERRRDEEHG